MRPRPQPPRHDPHATIGLRGAWRATLSGWRGRREPPDSTIKPWPSPDSTFRIGDVADGPETGLIPGPERPPAAGPETPAGTAPRAVPIVAGSSPHLSAATRALLRDRLRAVNALLLVLFLVGLTRSLIVAFAFEGSLAREFYRNPVAKFFLAIHLGLIALQGAAVVLLASRKPLSFRTLRTVELATFGPIVAYFACDQYFSITHFLRMADTPLTVVMIKDCVINTLLLCVTYGMFIPNRWPRALAVVGAMVAVPVAVQAFLLARYPALFQTVGVVNAPERILDNLAILLVGLAVAVVGTRTIHRLRVEAFEARQLGQYRLGERIGSGGMGEVFLAEHQLLKRPCAIKLIRPGDTGDPTALARFAREVRTTARLTHPNTIEVYDYGRTDDGRFYYVMEFLRGMNFDDLVTRHGPLPPGRAIYLLRQACEALAEAHAAGLVHRDLKPANLFAAERGGRHDFVKVLDFGLVKAPRGGPEDAGLSRDGAVAGTPLYMAPEQSLGEPVGPRSDLYSLGAVAYFLLAGAPPFPGDSANRVMVAHARDPVPPLARFRPDAPADLEGVIVRCLAKDPADRYPDAPALERALASCAAATDWDARQAAAWWRDHAPVTPLFPIPQPAPAPA